MDRYHSIHHVFERRLTYMLLVTLLLSHIIVSMMSIAHLMRNSIVSLLQSNPDSTLLSLFCLILMASYSASLVAILG